MVYELISTATLLLLPQLGSVELCMCVVTSKNLFARATGTHGGRYAANTGAGSSRGSSRGSSSNIAALLLCSFRGRAVCSESKSY